MDLVPLFKFYALFFNGAGCLLNLFLVVLFFYAYRRYRNQPAFLVFALGCLCAAFETGYLFASGIQRKYSLELFSYETWRILAYVYFVLAPLVFLSSLVGSILLVRTYGRNRIQSPDDRNELPLIGSSPVLTKLDPSQIQWRIPWGPVLLDHAAGTVAELHREMPAGHVLAGRAIQAVGRRQDCDDVLFYLGESGPQFAVVHLTYSRETQPEWPRTVLFDTLAAWIEQRMIPDAEDWSA